MNAFEILQAKLKKAESIVDKKKREFLITEAEKEYYKANTLLLEESGENPAINENNVTINDGEISFNLADMKAYAMVDGYLIEWHVSYSKTFEITSTTPSVIPQDTIGFELLLEGIELDGVQFVAYNAGSDILSNIRYVPISNTQAKLVFDTPATLEPYPVLFKFSKNGYVGNIYVNVETMV